MLDSNSGGGNPHDTLAMMPSSVLPLRHASEDPLRGSKRLLLRTHGLLLPRDDGDTGDDDGKGGNTDGVGSGVAAPWGRLSQNGHVGGRFIAALRIRSLSLSDLSALGVEPHGLSMLTRGLRRNRWYVC